MMPQSAQIDLFDLLAPAPIDALGTTPAHGRTSDGHAEHSRHWLVVTTKRARTACGTVITDYQFKERYGFSAEDGVEVLCTHDAFDGTVSCARCLEVRG